MLYYRLNKTHYKITFYNFENGTIQMIQTFIEWDTLKKELKKVKNEDDYLNLLDLLSSYEMKSNFKIVDEMDNFNKTKLY